MFSINKYFGSVSMCGVVEEKSVREQILEATSLDGLMNIARSHLNCNKHMLSNHQPFLVLLVNGPIPDLDLIKSVLEKAIAEFPAQDSTPSDQTFATWAEVYKENPEDLVKVTWGGGLHFLNKFLNCTHTGYAKEAGGRGMFFTVHYDGSEGGIFGRDKDYALRNCFKYFDQPATIEAFVPKGKLKSVNHNKYEAVLLPEDVSTLVNRKITDLTLQCTSNWPQRSQALQQSIPHTGLLNNLEAKGYTPVEVGKLRDCWSLYSGVHWSQFVR